MTKGEIEFLNRPEQTGFIPLKQRLVRYLNETNEGQWADPLEIRDQPDLLMRPFYFYGNFIALSQSHRLEYAEN